MCVHGTKPTGTEPGQPPRVVAGGTCNKTKGVKACATLSGVDRRNLEYILDLTDERVPRNIHLCEPCRQHIGRWVTADKKAATRKCTGKCPLRPVHALAWTGGRACAYPSCLSVRAHYPKVSCASHYFAPVQGARRSSHRAGFGRGHPTGGWTGLCVPRV